jgi:DNA/RNA-binding domain of Phe-tRNA-synthetase-like protein
MTKVSKQIDDPRLVLGVVEVDRGMVRDCSPALAERAADLAAQLLAEGYELPETKRRAVRDLLKLGGFSPTGRNKPAHEFLINDIQARGSFNHINNVVDANNVISLESLLPISIFDVDKLGADITVRIGAEGESYVFNPSGQVLDVKHCIVCARAGGDGAPVGTPVKDSLETKIFPGAAHFLAVMYSTSDIYSTYALLGHIQRFAELLSAETGGHILQANTV